MNADERWAYRARGADDLVEVLVVRIGTNRPPRVRVRFVAEVFEGREEWVPPGRLKVLWSGVKEFLADERRWAAVTDVSPVSESGEYYATSYVFDTLIDDSLADVGYRNTGGVTTIHDVDGLARFLDIDSDRLLADPVSFETADGWVVPWSITESIAQRAAAREPDPILRHVEAEEAEHQRHLIYGKTYPASRSQPAWHIEAQYFADSEGEPYNRPCWEVLRRWCGRAGFERRDELVELRREVARLGLLIERSIAALRDGGLARDAEAIERDLGVQVADLRGAR